MKMKAEKISGVYAIEGLDGAGKTTVARILSEMTGATYLSYPHQDYKKRFSPPNIFEVPWEGVRYYQEAAIDLKNRILGDERERMIILDRDPVITPIAYFSQIIGADITDRFDNHKSFSPENTFYMIVDEKIRLQRLMQKEIKTKVDEIVLGNPDISRRIEKEYLKNVNKELVIDATILPAKKVAGLIYEIIKS